MKFLKIQLLFLSLNSQALYPMFVIHRLRQRKEIATTHKQTSQCVVLSNERKKPVLTESYLKYDSELAKAMCALGYYAEPDDEKFDK